MFQDIFSEVILPRENTQQQVHTDSINSLFSVPIPKVCLFCHHYFFFKKRKKHMENKKLYVFLVFLSSFSRRRFC